MGIADENPYICKKNNMRYKFLLLLSFWGNTLFSQILNVSQNQLTFGNTFENAPDSLLISVTNPGSTAVEVSGIRFYKVYGSIPFSVRDSVFTLAPFASKSIWVKFSPLHNVAHNVEMVLLNNSHRGNVSVNILGQGKYSKTYYSHTENISEQTLKDTLQAITGRGYTQLGYNGARDKMFMNIDNKKVNGQGAASNTLECVYTGRNAVGYTSRSNCQSAFSFNTEHTYPQGYFSSAEPMVSDLFHLYPTDDNANNVRNSFRFGDVVDSLATWSDGGSMFKTPFFEPRDSHKGEVARAMFYFVVRYQNYQGFLTTQESTLRYWLHAFPPTTIERKRNTDIHSFQHNYNPFIDYPQLVDRISSISNTSVAAAVASIDLTDSMIDYGFLTPATNYLYNYVIVNKGNTTVNFTNLNVTNPAILNFVNGTGSNVTLLPGDALNIKININTLNADSLFEYLNFDTDIAGLSTVQVPIFANFHQLPLGVFPNSKGETALGTEMELFPNPTNGLSTLNYQLDARESGFILLYDRLGNMVYSKQLSADENTTQLDLSGLSQGMYICRLMAGNKSKFKKLILIK